MGMNLATMLLLQGKGFLSRERNRILDIGPQNVYFAKSQQIRQFVVNQGSSRVEGDAAFSAEVDRLVYFSTPRPKERTTLFSEITDLTGIEYNSFDVCPGLKTELLDLNFDEVPDKQREYYDVVLNFGTTEHIFNQWNCFEVMHDAVKVGGVIYHQLPASGYLDHGYYCYTPLFFRDLAAANGYVIEEMFLIHAGENFPLEMSIDIRDEGSMDTAHSVSSSRSEQRVPCFNIHAILRKTQSAPFRVGLEIATAHASAYDGVIDRYKGAQKVARPQQKVTDDDNTSWLRRVLRR